MAPGLRETNALKPCFSFYGLTRDMLRRFLDRLSAYMLKLTIKLEPVHSSADGRREGSASLPYDSARLAHTPRLAPDPIFAGRGWFGEVPDLHISRVRAAAIFLALLLAGATTTRDMGQ